MEYEFIQEVNTYQAIANRLGIRGVSHCDSHSEPTEACSDCEFRLDSAIRRISFAENK